MARPTHESVAVQRRLAVLVEQDVGGSDVTEHDAGLVQDREGPCDTDGHRSRLPCAKDAARTPGGRTSSTGHEPVEPASVELPADQPGVGGGRRFVTRAEARVVIREHQARDD